MDSSLFEGVDERHKSEFIGNFFHFIKCRFSDCNLVQTGSKINTTMKSEQPSAAVSKAREDETDLKNWGSGHGNHVPAYNDGHKSPSNLAQTTSPTASDSKKIQDEKDLVDWGSGRGNHVPSYNDNSSAPSSLAQTGSDADKKEKLVTNSVKEVQKQLEEDKKKELVKPTEGADNKKDGEPANVQLKDDKKDEKKEEKK